jgi:hypothetical protein
MHLHALAISDACTVFPEGDSKMSKMIKNFGGLIFSLLFNSTGLAAAGGTATSTLNYTTSTKNNYINTNTYIAELAGGPLLYEGPSLSLADGILYSNGAVQIIGPTLESTTIVNTIFLYSSAITTTYFGPQTIMVGDNQATAFTLLAGQTDIDVLVPVDVYQDVTYDLIGVTQPSTSAVPEPSSIIILGISGLLILPYVILRCRS